MRPYNTLRSIVFTLTTAIMFFCWGILYPIIQTNIILGSLIGGIVSLGSYRLVLKVSEHAILKIQFVKKFIFGNEYLEGKWIGCYIGLDGNPVYYIEYFEQTFDGLIIRGNCYFRNYSFKGGWVSDKVVLNETKGVLAYTYETDMIKSTHKNQGLAVFSLVREEQSKAPKKLIGFSSDIFSKQKILSIEIKIEDSITLSDQALLEKAYKLFEDNKDFFGK